MRKGFKKTVQDFVHKVDGVYIDRMEKLMFQGEEKLPSWVKEFAASFGKRPHDVLNYAIKYRNSWGYQLRKEGIR